MKLRNKIATILACVATVTAVAPLTACGAREENELNPAVDSSKTQLTVFTFDGGYGSEWLKKARTRFEAAYADVEFQPGKKGVQIMISPQKISGTSLQSRIPNMTEEIFFAEHAFYTDYVRAGLCLEITDIVNEKTLPGESKTIKSKMTDEQYAYFDIDDKVYGVPHYNGMTGITYNADFFDDNMLYFKQNWTAADPFTSQNSSDVSVGPDGQAGTDDDGLPITYDDFYFLCDYIADNIPSAKPLNWCGVEYKSYLSDLINSLYTDYEGKEQRDISYKLQGNVTHVVDSISASGEVSLKDPFEITPSTNGYEVWAQAGKYYGTKFLETIIDNPDWYNSSSSFSQSYSHLEAQKNFLITHEYGGITDYAMLIDGCWWESEADSTFKNLVQSKGDSASKYSRNFKWMPLPRPEASNQKVTMLDQIQSCVFIKKSIDQSKIEAAKAFVQFVNTDESLVEFTEITNTPKALNYTISDKSKLSNFGRSLMTAKENSDIVYSYNGSDIFCNNAASFTYDKVFQTEVDGTTYANPIEPIRAGISAKDIFEGYRKSGRTIWNGMTK